MKYRDFKAELDKYFGDDEEIYPHAWGPHAWGSCVTFYRSYHGQKGGLIESSSGCEMVSMTFKDESITETEE